MGTVEDFLHIPVNLYQIYDPNLLRRLEFLRECAHVFGGRVYENIAQRTLYFIEYDAMPLVVGFRDAASESHVWLDNRRHEQVVQHFGDRVQSLDTSERRRVI